MRAILAAALFVVLALPAEAAGTPRAAVELHVSSSAVDPAEIPRFTLVNTGDLGLAYGTPYRLERWKTEGWRWINRRQGWRAPLLGLSPGKTSRPEPIAIVRPNPAFERCPRSEPCCVRVVLRPGLYRVTKGFSSPLENITARDSFRIIEKPTGTAE
jgi:hypothetical protein